MWPWQVGRWLYMVCREKRSFYWILTTFEYFRERCYNLTLSSNLNVIFFEPVAHWLKYNNKGDFSFGSMDALEFWGSKLTMHLPCGSEVFNPASRKITANRIWELVAWLVQAPALHFLKEYGSNLSCILPPSRLLQDRPSTFYLCHRMLLFHWQFWTVRNIGNLFVVFSRVSLLFLDRVARVALRVLDNNRWMDQ